MTARLVKRCAGSVQKAFQARVAAEREKPVQNVVVQSWCLHGGGL